MSATLLRYLVLALFGLFTFAALPAASLAATPAEVAKDVRSKWADAKTKLDAAVKPLAGQPAHAPLIAKYAEATDKTGAALEKYLTLKLATPATAPAKMTPAVDELLKSLTNLKTLKGQATGPLITVLGNVMAQQQETVQNALKNIR